MKKWLKISIAADPALAASISDYLIGVIGAAVEMGVEDHIAHVTLSGFVEEENPDTRQVNRIIEKTSRYISELAEIFEVDIPQLSWGIIEDEDWGKVWKKHFFPFAIVPGLIIAPTWEDYQKKGDERVIVMDPGMAFGTGHHATTALSLGLICEELQKNGGRMRSVLDVGCGTGILGMAAAMFGAAEVLGTDNDPEALKAAGENIKRNNLSSVMKVSGSDLPELRDQYNLVVANIIHDVLVELAEHLQRVTKSGGTLIFSGILHGPQVHNITSVFAKHGCDLIEERRRDEWAALRLIKGK